VHFCEAVGFADRGEAEECEDVLDGVHAGVEGHGAREEILVGPFTPGDGAGREGGAVFGEQLLGAGDFVAEAGDVERLELMGADAFGIDVAASDPDAHLFADLGGDGAAEGVFAREEDDGGAAEQNAAVVVGGIFEGPAGTFPDMFECVAAAEEPEDCGFEAVGVAEGVAVGGVGGGVAGAEGFEEAFDGGVAIEEEEEGGAAGAFLGEDDEGANHGDSGFAGGRKSVEENCRAVGVYRDACETPRQEKANDCFAHSEGGAGQFAASPGWGGLRGGAFELGV